MSPIRSFAAERTRIPGGRTARLLALTAFLAGLSLLISSQPISAQETFGFGISNPAEKIRQRVEVYTSAPDTGTRKVTVERNISGKLTLDIFLDKIPRSVFFFEEADFTVTNGRVSNLRTPNNRVLTHWTVDLIRIGGADAGAVTVSIPEGQVSFTDTGGTQRRNRAVSIEFQAIPGSARTVWAGFTSGRTYTRDQDNPSHIPDLISNRNIDFAVIFSEAVVVSGTPHIKFLINDKEHQADYNSGSGTAALVFRHRLSDPPPDGNLSLKSHRIELPGGAAIKDAIGDLTGAEKDKAEEDAVEPTNVNPDLPVFVQRVTQGVPSLAKDSTEPRYRAGDVITWIVTFSRNVFVNDRGPDPFLLAEVMKRDGTTERVKAPYSAPAFANLVHFRYTIPPDLDIAPDAEFDLYSRHLLIPGGGFEIVDRAASRPLNTKLPLVTRHYTADVELREGESITFPVGFDAPSTSTRTLDFSLTGSSETISFAPQMVEFAPDNTESTDIVVTAKQDADADDDAAVTLDTRISASPNIERLTGLTRWRYVSWTITVLDDDPKINALTPPADTVDAGGLVEFQVTTASAPVGGREVTATITESGPDGSCIDLAALPDDVDLRTADHQIYVPISGTAGGTAAVSVPTRLAFVGECTVTVSIAAPTEADDERFFAITDSAGMDLGMNAALTASAMVIGIEQGPEPPTMEIPSDFALALSLDSSDAVVTPGELFNVAASLTYSGGRYLQPIEASSGRLHLPGAYFWERSGQRTLSFSGVEADCSLRLVDGASAWTCLLALPAGDAAVRIPGTAAPGRFTITGLVTIDDETYSDSLEVEVRERVDEVAEVTFAAAAQTEGEAAGEPYPTSILSGQSTRLQLRILNENKAASDPDSIAAINFHTNAGSLSASLGSGDTAAVIGCAADGLSCQIPIDSLTLANVGSIILTVSHPGPGKLGVAQVRAAVVDVEGESFLTDPVAVTFLGGGETLTISEPRSGLYYQDTADEGADQDDRDLLTLSVSAADAGGTRVEAPAGIRRWTIKGPNGRSAAGFSVAWPKGGENPILDASRNLQVEIDVDSSTPLPLGEYTLELQAGNLRAKQSFSVVSGAGSLTLSGPSAPLEVGETITITAELKDGSGRPVTDGTSVAWTSGSPSAAGVLIQLSADTAAVNGKAAARFFVIGRGSAYVRAESGSTADVLFTNTADASASEAAAVDYSEFIRGCNPSSWLGEPISASNLYPSLESASSLYYWTTSGWVRYGRHHAPGSPTHGRLIPGSIDFRVPTGGVISIIFAAETPCPFPPPGG